MWVLVHAMLFPNGGLLAVSKQVMISATLTVAVTYPITNIHEIVFTTIYPLLPD
jgi:hypothetical protein